MKTARTILGIAAVTLVLVEVNFPYLGPQSRLAAFALLGTVYCFLTIPAHRRVAHVPLFRAIDVALAGVAAVVLGYVFVQSERLLSGFWSGGVELGARAGSETALDVAMGVIGLVVVLEAARRALGIALPLLAVAALAYAVWGAHVPDWLFPHRGYGLERIVTQTFLHTSGVFGVALSVMFRYVFLFVVLGALLESTGATRFVIDAARRVFGASAGGPAKVSVVASGLMGSLSGSAVANTATTGTFTIPLMKGAGFRPAVAGGVEAAASSGGALLPPVMGAGAYMMLEIVEPKVTYLEVVRAALIPGLLYYVSLFLIVHFQARRIGAPTGAAAPVEPTATAPAAPTGSGASGRGDSGEPPASRWGGVVFVASIAVLVAVLLLGYSVFRAASLAIVAAPAVGALRPETRIGLRRLVGIAERSIRDAVPLIAAAACVGVLLGVVTLTGVGTKLPAAILGAAQDHLLSALALIMVASILLGMGLPSAVCYLLMATLVGPVLGDLGVVPLAAHLFIFYFGMMSMVTPPVALAAYAASSIAGSRIMETGFHAFRFALVGFTLPYLFVFRPALLLLSEDGGAARPGAVLYSAGVALAGLVPFAAGMAGFLWAPLGPVARAASFAAAACLLAPVRIPGVPSGLPALDLVGFGILGGVLWASWARARRERSEGRKAPS